MIYQLAVAQSFCLFVQAFVTVSSFHLTENLPSFSLTCLKIFQKATRIYRSLPRGAGGLLESATFTSFPKAVWWAW